MKKLLSILLLLVLSVSLVACGDTPVTDLPDTGSEDVKNTEISDKNTEDSDEKEEWKPLDVMDNKVLVSDYKSKRIIVYDLDLVGDDGDLKDAEIWVLENAYSASVKYREDTVFGDVILHTADYNASIVDYETKEVVWVAPGVAGWGVHSIEILPSGNIVTAGATDGILRIFNSANCVNEGDEISYEDIPGLPSAHGVLWDPEYNCLWALGGNELAAYRVVDNGDGTETLKKIQGMGAELPADGRGGHDLAADLLDTRYLWCTSSKVYRFDKEEGVFTTRYDGNNKLNKDGVKGFGNNLNNNFFYTQSKFQDPAWETEETPAWTTDTITYGYWKKENFLYLKKCVDKDAAFYKVRVFYGKYQ